MDPNVLFALLAMHLGFVESEAVLTSLRAWRQTSEGPFSEYLCEQGVLNLKRRALLEALLREWQALHGGTLLVNGVLDHAAEKLRAAASDTDLIEALAPLPAYPQTLVLPPTSAKAEPASGDDDHPTAHLCRPGVTPPSAAVPPVAVDGVKANVADTLTVPPRAGSALPELPGYEILSELGRGGMGVVYKARQIRVNRIVALKVVLAGAHSDAGRLARFLGEANAVAQLQHDNIIHLYEAGEHNSLPFFSMEFVSGGSLAQREKPLSPAEAAALVEQIAHGVQCAHENGIVHRDLKPANILLQKDQDSRLKDGADTLDADAASHIPPLSSMIPKITDFGVAKQTSKDSDLTGTGDIVGTPAYMAPEQARSDHDRVGPATDIYSLGAILYECLTGRPPFQGVAGVDTLYLVVTREPLPPSQLQPSIPRDLDTICLKCLQKVPQKRYATAAALADDLRRFRRGEPITARPVSRLERTWRWCKRNPLVAALLTAVAASLIFGTMTATTLAFVAYFHAEEADAQKQLADQHAEEARLNAITAQDQTRKAQTEKQNAETARLVAEKEKQEAENARLAARDAQHLAEKQRVRAEWLLYASKIGWARRELLAGNYFVARDVLDTSQPEFRDWEYRYLHTLIHHTGQRTLPADHLVAGTSISRDGKWIAGGERAHVKIWDSSSGQVVQHLPARGPVHSVAISPSGQLVACTTNNTVRVWEVQTGKHLIDFQEHIGKVHCVAFDSDERLASAGRDKQVRIWEPRTGKRLLPPLEHADEVHAVAFSQNSERLVTGTGGSNIGVKKGDVTLWNAATGAKIRVLDGKSGYVSGVAISPDGKWIAACGTGPLLRIWSTLGKQARDLKGHGLLLVRDVAFSPDSKRLVSAGYDKTIRLWDVGTGQPLFTLLGHAESVDTVAFSSDGKQIVSGSKDSTIKIWNAITGQQPFVSYTHKDPVHCVVFSNDGKRLASGGMDRRVQVWNPLTGDEQFTFTGHTNWISAVAFSPDNQYVASASTEKTVKIWDVETGKVLFTGETSDANQNSLAFAPRGRRLAYLDRAGAVRVWDMNAEQEVFQFKDRQYTSVAYSPDGRWLAGCSPKDKLVTLWNAANGQFVLDLVGHTGAIT
jgi:WD40 repeat protein/serine/threonine protein kinase